ncbi:15332_t:CDS:2, partial [Cetraspora pellucida]
GSESVSRTSLEFLKAVKIVFRNCAQAEINPGPASRPDSTDFKDLRLAAARLAHLTVHLYFLTVLPTAGHDFQYYSTELTLSEEDDTPDIMLGDLMLRDLVLGDLGLGDPMLEYIMLGDIMLGDIMLGDIMLGDIMLGDIMLGDIMLGVEDFVLNGHSKGSSEDGSV